MEQVIHEPVVMAEWEHYKKERRLSCSECGEYSPVIERWYSRYEEEEPVHDSWPTPYCPFCGAKMKNGKA
jgi:hypothetical protein